eukprot:m.77584 g.77584  ORF g.77584 m.77584 type:complete len:69 (+) comp36045_c0_seq5:3733-3939(+)
MDAFFLALFHSFASRAVIGGVDTAQSPSRHSSIHTEAGSVDVDVVSEKAAFICSVAAAVIGIRVISNV